MQHRIALAVEGPSDVAVLETICRKKGHAARAACAQGKDDLFLKFHKLLRVLDVAFNPTHFLIVVDLQPAMECVEEASRWRAAVHDRFPKAEVCLFIWELEAWLLADSSAVTIVSGRRKFEHANPDRIGIPKPSDVLEGLFRKQLRYVRGLAYDKEADGKRIAEEMDLEAAARNSASLTHFLRRLEVRQARLS